MTHVARTLYVVLVCTTSPFHAWGAQEPEWSFEVLIGDALNLNSRTHIQNPATGIPPRFLTPSLSAMMNSEVRDGKEELHA
jgi:hypothetical protein